MPSEMKNYNKPPTPKQKKLWVKLTEIENPRDISCEGGMSMAIGEVMAAKSDNAKCNVLRIVLPPGCFCLEFTERGIPKMATLADKRYNNGMAISQLGKAVARFSKVKKVNRFKPAPKHLDVPETRRPMLELKRPVLEAMPKIRRI